MSETLIFGPPGCGKTHTLIEIVRQELANGVPPDRIGFVSFSRKSIQEARERVGSQLSLTEKDMPWFKTLHSMGFNWLGMDKAETIQPTDFRKLGDILGMSFDSSTAEVMEEGLVPVSMKEGNKYLEVISRAKLRCISMEEEFNDRGDYDLYWSMLQRVNDVYAMYKSDTGKFDYTDMIELFVKQGTGPALEVLIVDEAQDLTPLQWKQVEILKQTADRVWYAGDDDQCIHRWNGVDLRSFMNACDNKTVLNKSYRVPRSVYELANDLVQRIRVRHPKDWSPRDEEGSVDYHINWYDVNIDKGSWTIMARTNKALNSIHHQLRDDGYLFERFGKCIISPEVIEAMTIWDRLAQGKTASVGEIKKMYTYMPKQGDRALLKRGAAKTFDAVDPQGSHNYDNLVAEHGLLAPRDTRPEVVVNMSQDDIRYMGAVRRRGEDLTKPRINLSTIHRMKGGEDDNILLLTDSSYPAVNNPDQDDEHRVFYTAVTRARHNLHIIDSYSKYRYEI
jgi:superfamily I DNA/RNA helicase